MWLVGRGCFVSTHTREAGSRNLFASEEMKIQIIQKTVSRILDKSVVRGGRIGSLVFSSLIDKSPILDSYLIG